MEIPGFQILGQLGEGPMSTVWKAHQISLKRTVAIKILKQKFTTRPNEIHPVLKEARAAAGLKHAGIIPIYDAGELDGTFYFVMEFVEGSTLGQLIRQKGVISPKSTLNAALTVVEVLNHAWNNASIVHRGLNPDNILIDSDGTVKVTDLGLAKLADPANLSLQLQKGTVEGKLNYTSPEQAKCSIRIDFRTDMYGLGATMYHMLTGLMPFSEFEPKEVLNQQLTGFLENPRDIVPAVTPGMAQLIARLMMKDYKARYADWSEVIDEIKRLTAGRASVNKTPAPAEDGSEPPVSTILPPKGATSAPAPRKRISVSTPTSVKAKAVAPPRLRIPWYVWIPAWLLLLGWWGFLIWSQLKLPPLAQPSAHAVPAKAPDAGKPDTTR